MKYTKLAMSLLFAGMLVLSGCGSSDSSASTGGSTPPSTGTPVPGEPSSAPIVHETSVVTIDGEVIPVQVTTEGFRFVGYEGKPVLLEFYGDTCPHCTAAIPMYNSLEAKYGNDILILTIESYGNLNNAGLQNFAANMGMQYRTVATENSGNMKAYAEELVGPMVGVPYLIILDRSGGIVWNDIGVIDESSLEGIILDLL